MTTYPWAILSLVFVAALETAAAAAPPPAQPQDEFALHKRRGDAARKAERWSEALNYYQLALALRADPVVTGRVGLVWLALGEFEQAAQRLNTVLNDTSTSLSKDERANFARAYSHALREVCRIDIEIDQADASVEIDGKERGLGRTDFWVFLKPGEHVIRARLSGFEDRVETIVTGRECQLTVELEMHPAVVTPPQFVVMTALAAESKALVAQSSAVVAKSDASISVESLYTAKLPPNPLKPSVNDGFVLGVGAWIPFGMTPGVGLGGQIHAGWRSRSWWEIGGELRGAVDVLGNDRFSARSVNTWAVAFTPCGRIGGHFLGCALVQVDGGGFGTTVGWLRLAVGIRGGLEFHVSERFYLGLHGDLLVHLGAPYLGYENSPLWAGKMLAGALGAGVLTFF